jgi:hypothetical protein
MVEIQRLACLRNVSESDRWKIVRTDGAAVQAQIPWMIRGSRNRGRLTVDPSDSTPIPPNCSSHLENRIQRSE